MKSAKKTEWRVIIGMEKEQKDEFISYYIGNNASNLYKLIYPMLIIKGVSNMEFDDYIGKATDLMCELLDTFDEANGVPFHNYFKSCLDRRVKTWVCRDSNRLKRKNQIKLKDKDGNDLLDENGKPVYETIPDIFIDTPLGDNDSGGTIGDIIEDKREVIYETESENVEKYLNSLSILQRKIVEMKMEGYTSEYIQEKLQISSSKLSSELEYAKRNRNISLFNKKIKTYKKTEEDIMQATVMEIDTTDSYRMDKNTLDTLLDDKMNGDINCNYISQRLPFQWTEEKVNKYYSRILNNQPITEIIICEVNEDGEKVSYLIDGLQRLSYAEAFKQGRMVCKKKGAEFTTIKYKDYKTDENGDRVFEDGRPKYEYKEFDIIGKKYSELPEFLQKRFDKFNVNVTRYFNCTPEMVDYHIRNYNNYECMSKSQYAITSISNDTVERIKNISLEHSFFKNNTKTTAKNETKGVLEEIVARTMMSLYFIDDWKKDLMDTLRFVDENATNDNFTELEALLDRFASISNESTKPLLTSANIPVWVAAFKKFITYGKQDIEFVKFMEEFRMSFASAKSGEFTGLLNEDGYNTYINRSTKDKNPVKCKIELVEKLMMEYLHIDIEETQSEEINTLDFIRENVSEDATEEDIVFYQDMLDDLTLNVDNNSKLLRKENLPSLLAIIAYSCRNDIDLDDWFVKYFAENSNYIHNQKQNFFHMQQDLNKFLGNEVKNAS